MKILNLIASLIDYPTQELVDASEEIAQFIASDGDLTQADKHDLIQFLDERIIDEKFINFKILKNDNEINIFFDKKNFFLIGWQIIDLYQNLNITYLSSVKKNTKVNKSLFLIPSQD